MSCEFTFERMVTFAETDMAGVMHFSNYYRWMEEIEHAFWRSMGMSVYHTGDSPGAPGSPSHAGEHALSWPRVRTACDYRSPARFEDVLTLALRVRRMGVKSLKFEVEFRRGPDHLARGETTCVCCEMRGGSFRSVEIPAFLREKLLPWIEQSSDQVSR